MFTEIFVRFLQQKGITAYRIAKETGISQGLMNEYKSGKKLPTLQNIQKIADYLDCSVDYLLGRTDNPYISGNYINGDNSVQAVQNSSVTINQGQKEADQENQELLNLIQGLPLKKRAKIITMIYDELEEEW